MDKITENKITSYLFLALLAILPFGQLPGMFLGNLLNVPSRIHPVDVIVFFIVIFTIIVNKNKGVFIEHRYIFVSLIFSAGLGIFSPYFDIYGLLYLLRLLIYITFFLICINALKGISKQVIEKSLVIVGGAVAIFGWIQYLLFPNLIELKHFGWDDHYYRLVSTIIDPAFTGILLTLAIILSISEYLKSKSRFILGLISFLIVTLGFTYSRASFFALFVGLFILLFKKQKKLLIAFIFILLTTITLLPRSMGGEGVKLSRTSSINQKIENYKDSLQIISKGPLFGVGYNNICHAKEFYLIDTSKQENSCYGLDNSLLFILATTGVIGAISFIYLFVKTALNMNKLWVSSLIAVLAHSMFTNTLFYPWVIIWISLLGISARLRSKV